MKVTKGALDGMKNKWNGLGKVTKKLLLALLLAYLIAFLVGMAYIFQYESPGERYVLFEKVNAILPVISLDIYKIIVSVFVGGVIIFNFIAGKMLRKRVLSGEVDYKITFDEESTEGRFLRMVRRLKTIFNLLISALVGLFLYKKEFYALDNGDERAILTICCGILFFVLMQLHCRFGYFVDRFVVNPLASLIIYVLYLVFSVWFVVLTSASAAIVVAGLLGGAFLMVLGAFFLYGVFWFLEPFWR